MRQYELVERVRRYNPNADEDLLNRAYVFAMKAHGTQKRASGDPFFSHPLEVAAILTDLKFDDATIVAAVLHDTIEDTAATREEIDKVFGAGDRRTGRGPDQAQPARLRLQARPAGGELPQAAARHRRRRARVADQARRPAAQHAHARLHAAGQARAHRPGHARHLRPARRPNGHAGDAQRARRPRLPLSDAGRLRFDHGAARGAEEEERRADRAHRRRAHRPVRAPRHQGRGQGPPEAGLLDLAQDGAQFDLVRTALRHLRVPHPRRHGRRLLRRRRRRPYDLAGGARPLQGLHLDAEAERLPLDPHHRDRPRQPARRTADPHLRHARDRRIRRRRACALQGQQGPARAGRRRREPRLSRPQADDRGLGHRRLGAVPRAHQARAVPGPGVLLHPQGAADRAAARRDRDRFRLRRAHRRRQFGGRGEDQRPHRAADLDACATATKC